MTTGDDDAVLRAEADRIETCLTMDGAHILTNWVDDEGHWLRYEHPDRGQVDVCISLQRAGRGPAT